jgi:hydrogenase nickel incorporation protein HypB
MKFDIGKKVLSENDRIAAENRKRFNEGKVFALNIMSSPGSGKTSLLERTIPRLGHLSVGVIEGDVETEKDARRIARLTANVVQINTHGACHLSAQRVAKAYEELQGAKTRALFIENIGNLVCPANYDLGEDARVIMVSVPEGDDKVEKYPGIFVGADAVLINKVDLLGYLDCDVSLIRQEILKVNSRTKVFEISCRTGEGIDRWLEWLTAAIEAKGGPTT